MELIASRCKIGREKPDTALLDLKYRQLKVLPPIGKQKKYPWLILTVLHAVERGRPKNRDRIEWKLITDLPVTLPEEAVEKLNWYALRATQPYTAILPVSQFRSYKE